MPRTSSRSLTRGLSRVLPGGLNPNNAVIDAIPCSLWLRFDEPSGTVAADSSGNGRSGILFNGAQPGVTGKSGQCVSLDGINDYVKVPAWAYGTNFTVAAWVKFPVMSGFYVIAANGVGGSSIGGFIFYTKPSGNGGVYACQIQDSAGTTGGVEAVGSGLTSLVGTWVHLAATYDGTNIRLYLNGQPDGAPLNRGATPQSSLDLMIGASNPSSPANFLTGNMDDLRVFPSALTAAQITALYNYT